MWAAIPFFTSLVLLAVFFGFRFFEEKQGKRYFTDVRGKLDIIVSKAYTRMVTEDIPQHYRTLFIRLIKQATHMVVVLVVAGLRAIERPLTRLSYRMRREVPSGNGKEPSAFLKTMTREKKESTGESEPDSV